VEQMSRSLMVERLVALQPAISQVLDPKPMVKLSNVILVNSVGRVQLLLKSGTALPEIMPPLTRVKASAKKDAIAKANFMMVLEVWGEEVGGPRYE